MWRPLALILSLVVALVQLAPGTRVFAADKDTGTVSGIVVVESGNNTKPVAGAEVRLVFGNKAETRRTGGDGKYTFVELLPGKYTVRVSAPDGMKPKGDGAISVTLAGGEAERADFLLLSTEKPTATPAPKATATPSPKPSQNQERSSAEKTPNGNTSANGPMPALVIPYASPSPPPSPIITARSPLQPQQQQSGVPSSLASSIGVAASPIPVIVGTPGLLLASGSPTPQGGPIGTQTPVAGEDVVASGPPRRLINSFEALRDTGAGGAAAQLMSSATETSLVLGVPFRTQIDGTSFSLVNCGPASLAMVLNAFGMRVDPPGVRDYLNFLVGNYDTEAGTSLYVLARIAREAGLNTFGTSAGLQGWTIESIREHVRAGHPVITLTKYRFLPGHFGSVTDFDHYIVITGLAGDDFVYNDAAYSTEYGYNLLISPSQLQRAWAASSVPRHAVAIGFGDSLHPLPIVPRSLTAESLVAVETMEEDEVQMVVEPPIRVNRGPAAEWLREQTLDVLGARTMLVDGEPLGRVAMAAPATRIDPVEAAVQERPSGAALTTSYERPPSVTEGVNASTTADGVADTRGPAVAGAKPADVRRLPPDSGVVAFEDDGFSPFGPLLAVFGLLLVLGGGFLGWRRYEPGSVTIPTSVPWSALKARLRRLPVPRNRR